MNLNQQALYQFKKLFIALLVLLLLTISLFFLNGCSPQQQSPLRVGTNTWPGYESLYIARELGLYKESSVHLIELPSASNVMHEFRNNNLEVAALTLDEALTLLVDDIDLQVILVMDFSNGGDVLLGKPHIETLAELKGGQVALEDTAVGAILLQAALSKAKIELSDVSMVPCTVDAHLKCYDEVDAIVTFDPAKTQLQKIGANLLFDSAEIPGKIVDVLVVRKSILKENINSLNLLVDGHFKALKFLKENATQASKWISQRLNVSPQEALDAYQGLKFPTIQENIDLLTKLNSESESILDKNARSLAAFMATQNMLEKLPEIQQLSTPSFLPAQ